MKHKDFHISMLFNKKNKINIEIEKEDEYIINDENIINKFKEIMLGKKSLPIILEKGVEIINKDSFSVDEIKNIIKSLKNIFDILF